MTGSSFTSKGVAESDDVRNLKKLHLVAGKIIVVLEPNLIEKLRIDVENTWFQVEEVEDGILLKPNRPS